MGFNLQEREIAYTTPDGKISFVPNRSDGSEAYDVIVGGRDHLYIHDRTLPDLIRPEVTTQRMMSALENMSNGTAQYILQQHEISPEDFHMALLQLKIAEQEREIERALETDLDKLMENESEED